MDDHRPEQGDRRGCERFTPPDGRIGSAHCPEDYNRLELEAAATGERRTESVSISATPADSGGTRAGDGRSYRGMRRAWP
ncbi:hypothetical protein GPX89_12380 [Nocardia sp. ET3-3]|uniref:Uncharacterized protein n=1 Tax=Nocardia terrae TaxID=2675851 RepID=A0A7K1UV45_9NOCA|nr:hypothetical protein [Nocardia terrae]MVU78039.1 hypothetical protein [Nocardia terrae]